MHIIFTKAATGADIAVRRADGSSADSFLPAKGPVPHDAVHYFVERELGVAKGFWGLVAAGHHPEDIAEMAKQAGHASAKRAEAPDPSFVEAIQVERIVEAFEADHWSGGRGDPAQLSYLADAGCAQSLVPPFPLDAGTVARVRAAIADFAARWAVIAPGDSMSLDWDAEAS